MKSQLNHGNEIFEKDDDVDRIIQNALQGNWTAVWDILDKKEYLVNCIPFGRTWGVLHHAVYMGHEDAVKKLMSYPTCDPCILTLLNPEFGPGETPADLTKNSDIISILKGYDPVDQNETQGVTKEDKDSVKNTFIGTNILDTSQMENYAADWGNTAAMNIFHSQNQSIGIYLNQKNYLVNSQTYPPNIPQTDYGYNFQQQNYGQTFQQSFNQGHVPLYETQLTQQPYNGPDFYQELPYTAHYEGTWFDTNESYPPHIHKPTFQQISSKEGIATTTNKQPYYGPDFYQELPHTAHYDTWINKNESYPPSLHKPTLKVQSMAKTHTFQQKPNKQGIATTTNKQPNTLNHTTTPNILPTTTKPKYPCDAELISAMVYSAKHGKWDIVWEILDTKPHLINCIPSDRAWSVLHQAVWKNDVITVHKLLSYPACDPEIKTKLDKTNDSGIGKKPIDLAKCENIKAMLRKAASKKQKINNDAPTMLPCNKWENYLGECIQMTLSCCQDVLVPKKWSITHHNSIQSISTIMQTIFHYINTSNNWIKTRDNVSLTVQQFCNELGNELWSRNELVVDSKEQFFKRVINLYTEETLVYREMNRMLRLQDVSIQGHTTNGSELSLGPYALLLNAILMYWNVLKRYTGRTYR